MFYKGYAIEFVPSNITKLTVYVSPTLKIMHQTIQKYMVN